MITLTTVGNPQSYFRLLCNFPFTTNFMILTGECTKLLLKMNLFCQKGHQDMSLATIGCN